MNSFESILNDVLVDTFNYILKYEEASLKKISNVPITISEAHMIEAVGKQGNKATVSKIAFHLNIARPTATVAIKKLESKGLITKLPCAADGRKSMISLTAMGKKIDRSHRIFHRTMVRNISGQFLDTEKEILLTALEKLSGFFKEKVEA